MSTPTCTVPGRCGGCGAGRRPRWWRTLQTDGPEGALSGPNPCGTFRGFVRPHSRGFAMRRALRALVVAGTAAAEVGVVATPASAAACRVTNGSAAFGSLQAAVDAAAAGDRLMISGTCTGSTDVSKDLTLAGSAPGPDRPVLSGGGTVRPLTIEPQATVTLTDVIIRNGSSGTGGGGGVQSVGSLKAIRVLVTGNRTSVAGGGILNLGDLVLTRSLVSNNRSPLEGGGIFNAGDLVTWSTDIKGNTAGGVGGGMFAEDVATRPGGVVPASTAGDTAGGILTDSVLTLDKTLGVGTGPDDCPACGPVRQPCPRRWQDQHKVSMDPSGTGTVAERPKRPVPS